MKYKTIYKVFYPDGKVVELDCMAINKPYFDNFRDAANDANKFNEHIWKFHQDQAEYRFYFVKEI